MKSWYFYGAYNNNSWECIDSKTNMIEHNAQSYVGNYAVNKSGPFKCFKIEVVESWYKAQALTFRRFDLYLKAFLSPILKTHINQYKYHNMIHIMIFICFLFTSK